tara:strand:- start:201 stop:578 length:378 start_codon:yes stop_codon:yes gene_type:complete
MKIFTNFALDYWREITIVVMLITISVLWWHDHSDLVEAYEASVQSYETRIQELKESHERETERKNKALELYKKKLLDLELEYMLYQDSMAEAQAKKVKEIVDLRKENPSQLIQEIKDKFGFKYVE